LPTHWVVDFADGFGAKGRVASETVSAVPPNADLKIELELVSWKTVEEITDDKKVTKKILTAGTGHEQPKDGAVVKGEFSCQLKSFLFIVMLVGN
jgi:FK506-binding protein 4/5